ncbi:MULTISPECIES: RNA polymerase sigma factor [Roseivirga]|uniref:RNA polymerase sigma factor n=2 Tax=Roseivirga spongicola TaxID=333140 RepID=A0A150XBP4_9BACT|nr:MULTISPECIES: RNA polymerase sigma factor [Roseivirga]PWL28359.1 MAG: RNA polymerase sigma factor [Roseivirga sp. XM-24bin3]KYG76116.1 RNA polymerase [Roseivirga spongicola]MBO6494334.1 RNA polymerase sigma factor [Roseivirga sp.]MBO6659308.1 RNA polymerase sigma factor [Roseivirga sp.]MBO6762794.1 RNA polymerase sigma factor [Roseivirga sp.]
MNTSYHNIHQPIIDRCLQGDRTAHYEIYKLYSKAMYNTCLRITGNEMDAEDVLQESFVSAFKNLSSFKGSASFGSWLKRIVVNNAINAVKKRRMNFESVDGKEDESAIAEPVEEANLSYDVGLVKEGISKLPEGYRLVLTLYLIEGYDHKEIGQILDITESTSKSQFNRSKKKLREILKEELKYAG